MKSRKTVFAIIGSASNNSSNLKLVEHVASLLEAEYSVTVFDGLKGLPHFDPQLSIEETPEQVIQVRDAIEKADGILICTPEYVYSIPSGLKNLLEWCVSTTILTDKPVGVITASAHGATGHTELQRILRTLNASLDAGSSLLIQGIKGKINATGTITHPETKDQVAAFAKAFKRLVSKR